MITVLWILALLASYAIFLAVIAVLIDLTNNGKEHNG